MDKNKFGCFIKEKRKEKGFTQKALAEILLIDVTAVSKWERGVTFPDITMIPDICKALSVSEHELIESSNDSEYRKMKSEAKKYKKIKDALFYTLSICYLTAVLTCFIVNLAVEHTLSWFFIVLTSCLSAFTFVPSVTRFINNKKLLIYLSTNILSLFLLFFTVSIYTGDYWVWTATASVILGYFLVFAPILFSRQKEYLKEETYLKIRRFFLLFYTIGTLALTLALLVIINAYHPYNLFIGVTVSLNVSALMFAFSVIEILPIKRLTKLSLYSLCFSLYGYSLNGFLNSLLGERAGCYAVDFSNFSDFSNGNVAVIVLVFFLVLALILFLFSRKKR